jgi:hypothetical protein
MGQLQRVQLHSFDLYSPPTLADGFVMAAMSGMAVSVPTAVLSPSCHHTKGAMELRFHRTNPKGTEYTTAETAMHIHTAKERSYSMGAPVA